MDFDKNLIAAVADIAPPQEAPTIDRLERRKESLEYDIKRLSEKLANINEVLALARVVPAAAKILELLDIVSE